MLRIPDIDVGEVIGEGAMGAVYAAWDKTLECEVAVKVVHIAGHLPPDIAERALQEGELLWSLDHPNIVRVHRFGRLDDGSVFMVMERLRGETLHQRVRRGVLSLDETLRVISHVARGLEAIHARGAVHRDVKPDNIYLVGSQQARLLDLGIARLGDEDPARRVQTIAGGVFGTPGFMAPEQILGQRPDARADIWGLGATLVFSLTGRAVLNELSIQEHLLRVANLREPPPLPDGVSPDILPLVRDMLQPRLEGRIASMSAVLARLGTIASGHETTVGFTTVTVRDRDVRVPGLELPSPDGLMELVRFRDHILEAVASVFDVESLPPRLDVALRGLRALQTRRKLLAARRDASRRAADEAAAHLAQRKTALSGARRDLLAERAALDGELVGLQRKVMAEADRIRDLDDTYFETYRRLMATQRAARTATEAGDAPLQFEALFDAEIQNGIASLDALRRGRAARAALQGDHREAMRALHSRRTALAQRAALLDQESLVLDVERDTRLAVLEADARTEDDRLIELDLEIEHAHLLLGVEMMAALRAGAQTGSIDRPE